MGGGGVGGGDGGVCARVLQHDWVDRLTLVDIDAKVIDVSRRHFPSFDLGNMTCTMLASHHK